MTEYNSRPSYEVVGSTFQREIDAITKRELTPKNIDSYADDALADLVEVIQTVESRYNTQPVVLMNTGSASERAAFTYFGLDPDEIERTLDHIADVAESTHSLDDLILDKTIAFSDVILPPNNMDGPILEGSGTGVTEKRVVPKTKTLLLLLEQRFNVDLRSDDVAIYSGNLPASMMRSESYRAIEIKSLQRLVLVCDEVGNATFIIDTATADTSNVSVADLMSLTKQELKDLISTMPGVGAVTNHSRMYVTNLTRKLQQPLRSAVKARKPNELTLGIEAKDTDEEVEPEEINILAPKVEKASGNYLSLSSMADLFGVSTRPISKILSVIPETELGEVRKYKFAGVITNGYSPEQQEVIRQYLEINGNFADKAQEGYLSASGICELFEISGSVLKRALSNIPESELGEVQKCKFGPRTVPGYSPEQQEVIRQYLEANGHFIEKAPDGYLSALGMTHFFGVSTTVMSKLLPSISKAELGEVPKYKFGANTTAGYSPEQQEVVRQYLEANGHFIEKAPDGYLSARGLCNLLKKDSRSMKRVLSDISESELGEVREYKFAGGITLGYSPEQQETIRRYLTRYLQQPPLV